MGRRVWILAGAAALLSIVGGGAARWSTWDDNVARGSEHRDLGRPVAMQPAAVAALNNVAKRWARGCQAGPAPPRADFDDRLDAVARVDCRSLAPGVNDLVLYRFPSSGVLLADWDDVQREFPRAAGACDGDQGDTYWTDRVTRRRRGAIVCGRTDSAAIVYWTDDARRERYLVSGTNLATVEQWWTDHIRPQGDYPTAAEEHLLHTIKNDKHIDPSTCHRSERDSPMALAAVYCDGGKTTTGGRLAADFVHYETFATVNDTRARILADANRYAPGVDYDGKHETFLGRAATTYSLWRSDDGVRRGDLIQFTSFATGAGTTWVGWTDENDKMYSLIGRADQDTQRTFAAVADL